MGVTDSQDRGRSSADDLIERLGPPPRDVKGSLYSSVRGWTHYMLGALGLFVVLPAVIVPLMLLRVGDPREEREIKARNATVPGEVLKVERTTLHFGSTHVYKVLVRYRPREAADPLERYFHVGGPLAPGQKVTCAYVPEDPKRAALVGIETAGDLIGRSLPLMLFLLAITPAGMLIAGLVVWRRSARRVRLLNEGDVTRGAVTRIARSFYHVGRKQFRWVHYRYSHPSEGETEARYLTDPTFLEGVGEGSAIAVVYDAYDARRSIPVFAAAS